jgi:hypothetical protein
MWIGLCSLYSKFFHLTFCGYRFFDQFGHQIVFLASSHLSLSMKQVIVSPLVLCVYDIALPWHRVLFNVFACKGSKFCQVQTVAHLQCFFVHNYLFSWDNFSIPSGSCAKISGPV